MTKKLQLACIGSLLAACGMAIAGDAVRKDVTNDFPGVRLYTGTGKVTAVYGMPMTQGVDPAAAASQWWTDYGRIFGVENLDLVQTFTGEGGNGRFTTFHYTQRLGGLPVDSSVIRLVVLNGDNRVIYATAKVAGTPEDGFKPDALTDEQALTMVSEMPIARGLIQWTEPQLVVYSGGADWSDVTVAGQRVGEIAPVRAWTFAGDNMDRPNRERLRFFVDAATGAVVGVRSEIHQIDVSGKVTAFITPGTRPDVAGNAPVERNLEGIRVAITGGNNVFSNEDGTFLIPHGGNTQVTVTSAVGLAANNGRWVHVDNVAGAETSVSVNVTPPGPANLVFNAAPSAQVTAQVNAFYHQNLTHDFIKDRAPSFNALDTSFRANVNIADTCNAYYDGASTNYFLAGGGCVNTAYSSVVSHEYGHHIVNRLGLSQGAFGEGFGDVTGMLLHDSPIVGEDFFTNGGDIRRPDESNTQYPCPGGCGGEVHCCGEQLGGVYWEIVKNMRTTYGSSLGMTLTQQLFVDWAVDFTAGGQGNDSAHPQTAIEVLMANDIDGNLNNGTPDYDEICAAFAAHGIDCPEVSIIIFEYPNGRPDLLPPGVTNSIAVNVVGVNDTPTAGTGKAFFSLNGGGYSQVSMTQGLPNQYTVNFPVVDCGDDVRYYFSSDTSASGVITDPKNAPTGFYAAGAGDSFSTLLDDDFEANLGWTAGAAGDNATTGIWVRGDPNGTEAQPEDDHTNPGTQCFFTGQGTPGGGLGENDVDGGSTTLLTPVLDLSTNPEATISYWRWYSNDTGATPNTDIFVIDISNNNGGTWTRVETIGPSGIETSGGWFFHEFRVADFVTPTNLVKMRFIASDLGDGSLVEAALDDFLVRSVVCDDTGCLADMDGNGVLNVFDFLAFQTLFTNQDPRADIDGNGVFNVFDFLGYQTLFSLGC